MISSLHIGNFKAFADTQHIPIRPLTLIFGANSAGKSSILQGLLLAAEGFEKRDLDIFKTTIGGESVDLGGFRQYVHRRNLDNRVSMAFDLNSTSLESLRGLELGEKQISALFEIGLSQKERMDLKPILNKRTNQFEWVDVPTGEYEPGNTPKILTYEVSTSDGYLLRMSRRPNDTMQVDNVNEEHPLIRHIFENIVLSFTLATSVRQTDWETLAKGLSEIVPTLSGQGDGLLPDGFDLKGKSEESNQPRPVIAVGKGSREEDLREAVKFFFPRRLDAILKDISNELQRNWEKLVYLGPLRSYPERYMLFSKNRDPDWKSGGGYAWDLALKNQPVREKINAWLSDPSKLSTPYSLEVGKLYALGDVIDAFKNDFSGDRLERLRGELDKLEKEVGGEYFADEFMTILRKTFPKKKWDKEFSIDKAREVYEQLQPMIHSLSLDYSASDLIEDHLQTLASILESGLDSRDYPYLYDHSKRTIVSHRDVGVGISQALPVLAYAYANKEKLIAIEQPEIHLHPALQAELGDVFIESALGERNNTLLLETHSEHLILRVMRRMRDTVRGKRGGEPPVRPADVALLFVTPDSKGSIVRELRLKPDGSLLDEWPGGFFEDNFRELFS